ncbi:MAG: hypothetical protein ABJG15_10495 [Hyphomonadaceae bacterium]
MRKTLPWIIAAAALLGACSNVPTPADVPDTAADAVPADAAPNKPISFEGERATQEERAKCEAANGTVVRAGILGWERCTISYADAGNTCSGSSDCLGDCRLTSFGGETETPLTGTCQINDDPFGCYQTVEGGEPGISICVD